MRFEPSPTATMSTAVAAAAASSRARAAALERGLDRSPRLRPRLRRAQLGAEAGVGGVDRADRLAHRALRVGERGVGGAGGPHGLARAAAMLSRSLPRLEVRDADLLLGAEVDLGALLAAERVGRVERARRGPGDERELARGARSTAAESKRRRRVSSVMQPTRRARPSGPRHRLPRSRARRSRARARAAPRRARASRGSARSGRRGQGRARRAPGRGRSDRPSPAPARVIPAGSAPVAIAAAEAPEVLRRGEQARGGEGRVAVGGHRRAVGVVWGGVGRGGSLVERAGHHAECREHLPVHPRAERLARDPLRPVLGHREAAAGVAEAATGRRDEAHGGRHQVRGRPATGRRRGSMPG